MRRFGPLLSMLVSGLLGAFLLAWIWPSEANRVPPKTKAMDKVKTVTKPDVERDKPKMLLVTPVYLPAPPPLPEPELVAKPTPVLAPKPEPIKEPSRIKAMKPVERAPQLEKHQETIAEIKPIKPQPKPEPLKPTKTELTPLKPAVEKRPPPLVEKDIQEPIKLKRVEPAKNSKPKTVQKNKPKSPAVITRAVVARAVVDGTDYTVVKSGRVMLKLLEHGSGPKIEIIWPGQSRDREVLFKTFTRCYGMIVAVMDSKGGLYVADGEPRRPWKINLDRYSGFVRQSAGRDTGAQRSAAKKIRARHRNVVGGPAIRIFPRTMDAVLLGGLKKLVGASYAKSATIKADYRLLGNQVIVERVRVDGDQISGRVDLSGSLRPSCSI